MKKYISFFVAMAAVAMSAAAFAETPSEQCQRRTSGWTPEQEASYQSTGKYYRSVIDLDNAVRDKKAYVDQEVAEVEAQKQQVLQRETAVRQAEEQLVQRRYYWWDDYYGRYYGAYINCPVGWAPPWDWGWSVWTPYVGIPIYGWVGCGWRGNRVVVNNYYITQSEFDRTTFNRNFSRRFGRTQFDLRQPRNFSSRKAGAGFNSRRILGHQPVHSQRSNPRVTTPNQRQPIRQYRMGRQTGNNWLSNGQPRVTQQRLVRQGNQPGGQNWGGRGRPGIITSPWHRGDNHGGGHFRSAWSGNRGRSTGPTRSPFIGRRSRPLGSSHSQWGGGRRSGGQGHAPANWGNRGGGHHSGGGRSRGGRGHQGGGTRGPW